MIKKNLFQQHIFPFEHEKTYQFPEFKITTITSRHVGPPQATDFQVLDPDTQYERTNALGGLFNSNFILETPTNLRVGFCAGVFEDPEKSFWMGRGVNVFIRQMSWQIRRHQIEDVAEDFMATGAQIMIPMHHEEDYKNEDKNAWAQEFNEYVAAKGYSGRCFMPERAKWHTVNFGVTAV